MTRPEPDATTSAARLRELGHEVIVSPVLETAFSDDPVRIHRDADVALTSRNGARALVQLAPEIISRTVRIFTVGNATARLLRESGFQNVLSAQGAVDDLVALIFEHKPEKVHYICGRDRKGDLDGKLAKRGISVSLDERYRADFSSEFTKDAMECFYSKRLDGVLHYSTRSAQAYQSLLEQNKISYLTKLLKHFCLAKAVASVFDGYDPDRIMTAAHPNEDALFQLLE